MNYKKITAAALATMTMSAGPAIAVNAELQPGLPGSEPVEQREAQQDMNQQSAEMPQDKRMNAVTAMEEQGNFRMELPPEQMQEPSQNFSEPILMREETQSVLQEGPAQGEEGGNEDRPQPPANGKEMNGPHPDQGMAPNGMTDGERPEGMPEMNGERPEDLPELNGERPEDIPEGDLLENLPEELQDNEEAKGIIEEIKSLFQKLKDLFKQNGSDQETESGMRPNQSGTEMNGVRPEGMNEMNGRPGEGGEGENGMPGIPGGEMNSAPENISAATTLTADTTEASYSSSSDSENAVLVSGYAVSISGSTINKTGNASGDNADFYGINAAVLANDGATLTISDVTVTTDGTHANGIFSYGTGTTVTVSDSTITTTGNNSGGVMVTGGGTINATNLEVTTSGNSSAAIRSDRGGGTANVTSGSYSTSGVGSPAIYSTADINVSSATLSSSSSEAVVIEGGNSVTLTDCDVTGSNSRLNGQSTIATNVLIYQSMSGDASEGASDFTMTNGSLTSLTGAMFHVTNTTTTITLKNVALTYASDSNVFLDASADSWGTSGKNGGTVTLNLEDQDITGIITCDTVSSVTVNLDSDSSWTLSGDSYVTAFNGDLSKVNLNGYTLYINGVAYNG